jgi:hypothetical protein
MHGTDIYSKKATDASGHLRIFTKSERKRCLTLKMFAGETVFIAADPNQAQVRQLFLWDAAAGGEAVK